MAQPLSPHGEIEERTVQARSMRELIDASDRREIACYRIGAVHMQISGAR